MICASTERPPGSSGRHLIRHLKNRRPTEGLPIILRRPENTITANAGRCASRPPPGRSIPADGGGTAPPRGGKILRRTNLSGFARAPRLPPPQLRADACTASTGAGGNAGLLVIPAGCSSPGEEGLLKKPTKEVVPKKSRVFTRRGGPPWPPVSRHPRGRRDRRGGLGQAQGPVPTIPLLAGNLYGHFQQPLEGRSFPSRRLTTR